MKNWDQHVDSYISYCGTRGLATQTIEHRESELARFKIWIRKKDKNLKVEDVNLEILLEYIKSRTTFLSKSSSLGVICTLRSIGVFSLKMRCGCKILFAGLLDQKLITPEKFQKIIIDQI
jgi:site-specific recombinase XerD